jgi:hypothetical protein
MMGMSTVDSPDGNCRFESPTITTCSIIIGARPPLRA